MKDWDYEPKAYRSLPPAFQVGLAAPVFHVYRVYLQRLN
jgi:hypothetical protein